MFSSCVVKDKMRSKNTRDSSEIDLRAGQRTIYVQRDLFPANLCLTRSVFTENRVWFAARSIFNDIVISCEYISLEVSVSIPHPETPLSV